MKFCEICGTRLSREHAGKLCNRCTRKNNGTNWQKDSRNVQPRTNASPKPVTSLEKKPPPPHKPLLPFLDGVAQYRRELTKNPKIEPNKSQKEIVTKIEDAIKNNRTNIVISAPTGCGKSWIAATMANAYDVVVLTSTNDLQDQYCGTEKSLDSEKTAGDFDFMNAVRGKKQYLCELSENTTDCSNAYCTDCEFRVENKDIAIHRDGLYERIISNSQNPLCSYYKADIVGKKSSFSVYSYASYISRMKAEQLKILEEEKLPEKTILICDEAHDYDKVVSDQLSVELDLIRNKKIVTSQMPEIYENDDDDEKIRKSIEIIEQVVESFENASDIAKTCAKHSMILRSKKHLELHEEWMCREHGYKYVKQCSTCKRKKDEMVEGCQNCDKHLDLIDGCSRNHTNVIEDLNKDILYIQDLKFILPGLTEFPDNYVISKIDSRKVKISPWKTAWFTRKMMNRFNLSIFMSATINRTILSKETGISEEEFEFIDQHSEIPLENRKINFLNRYYYKDLDDDRTQIVEEIKKIFDKHMHEKGIILCTQYADMEKILNQFEMKYPTYFPRLTKDGKGTKFKTTIKENNEKSDGVIISAKAGTGIDLKDDLSRFQIIVKAPYMTELTDENDLRLKKIREADDKRFFIKSMFRLVQFCGRSVRGKEDYAKTYVLDKATNSMIYHNKQNIPSWFLEACVGC